MRLEAFRALLKMRRANTQASKIALAHAIAAETDASTAVAAADARMEREAQAALSLGADDGAVELYARWLPVGRQEAMRTRATLTRASQEVDLARTGLSLAKAAEHAVEQELDKVLALIASARVKALQTELDEVAGRRRDSEAPLSGGP